MKTNQTQSTNKSAIRLLVLALLLGSVAVSGPLGCAGNRYKQSTGEYIDDNTVKLRVNSALGDNPDYKFKNVEVTVFKGTVQLSGFVDLDAQKTRAGDIAKNVTGVKSVSNDITVRDQAKRTAGQNLDDKTIASKVEDGLKSYPDYKFSSVKVAVASGTVQLSGFVDTKDQRSRATEIAKNTEGVKSVVDNILVKDSLAN